MSDLKEMIVDVVEKMFSHHIKKETVDLLEEGKWATNLWDILIKNEIVYVTVSEKNGGAGEDVEFMHSSLNVQFDTVEKIGDDLCIIAYPKRTEKQ